VTERQPRAPAHLSAASKAWFVEIAEAFELEAHHRRLLALAASAWDRGERARKVLASEGLTFTDKKGAPRARPENTIVRDAATVFARLVRELRLDVGPPDDAGRKPRLPGGA
jgi:phage terminase small subunit